MKLRLGAVVVALVSLTAACSAPPGEDLGSSEEGVTVCGQTTVKGIDVYHGDNGGSTIDWNKVKAAGISFGIAKATESTNFTDSMFAKNWAGMKAAGLVRGAYHFFHSDVDPTQQATFFLATVGPLERGDLLVLDLETMNGQTQATVLAHAETFMAAVKSQSGVTPILYTSPAFLSSYGSLGQYPLWVANYGVSCPGVPSAWKTYEIWQSTGTGSLSALSGNVDLDTFNGSASDLLSFADSTWPETDAGTTTDGGATTGDDGGAKHDAGSDAGSDVGDDPTSGDAGTKRGGGAHAANWSQSGCDAAPAPSRSPSAWLAALAALAVLARRRRPTPAQARAKR